MVIVRPADGHVLTVMRDEHLNAPSVPKGCGADDLDEGRRGSFPKRHRLLAGRDIFGKIGPAGSGDAADARVVTGDEGEGGQQQVAR